MTVKRDYIVKIRSESVDVNITNTFYDDFIRYCDVNGYDEDPHYLRNCQTLEFILNNFKAIEEDWKILETGGLSLLGTYLKNQNYNITTTKGDLRYPIDILDNQYDLILSLEVFEHIKDQREEKFDDLVLFNYSGVGCYIKEMHRILKPNGNLILSTPNSSSYTSIINACEYKPSFIFKQHVREYSKEEILDFFVSFSLIKHTTNFSFFSLGLGGRKKAKDFFEKINMSDLDRGDDHIFFFKKI